MQREVLPRDCESAGLLRDRPVNVCPATTAHVLRLRSPRVVPPGPLWMRNSSLCPKTTKTTTTPPKRKLPRLRTSNSPSPLPPQLRPPLLLPKLPQPRLRTPKKTVLSSPILASTAASSPPSRMSATKSLPPSRQRPFPFCLKAATLWASPRRAPARLQHSQCRHCPDW